MRRSPMDATAKLAAQRRATSFAATAALLIAASSGAPPAATTGSADDARLVAALRAASPLNPIALEGDPYGRWRGREPPRAPGGTVCGVRFEPDRVHYRLATFATKAAARESG